MSSDEKLANELLNTANALDKLSLEAEHDEDTPMNLYNRAIKAIKTVPDKDCQSDMLDTLNGFLKKDAHGVLREVRDNELQWKSTDADLCDDLADVCDGIRLDV